jgi:hypothetical protein
VQEATQSSLLREEKYLQSAYELHTVGKSVTLLSGDRVPTWRSRSRAATAPWTASRKVSREPERTNDNLKGIRAIAPDKEQGVSGGQALHWTTMKGQK